MCRHSLTLSVALQAAPQWSFRNWIRLKNRNTMYLRRVPDKSEDTIFYPQTRNRGYRPQSGRRAVVETLGTQHEACSPEGQS